MLRAILFSFFMLCLPTSGEANPFAIDFSPKETLNHADYLQVQQQLSRIDMKSLLQQYYPPEQGYTSLEDFSYRCHRGVTQVLIDPEKQHFPEQQLKKIGAGGDQCIVSCAPYDGIRSLFIDSLVETLEKVGFNGYFYYRVGGFPNPTGKEIRYAGVPYSFKIFMMMEAYQQGFSKVLWIDSAAIPLQDPAPLFDWLEETGAFLYEWKTTSNSWRYIFPLTKRVLKEMTGTDVLDASYICTIVFGLKMNSALAQKLIAKYYQLVEFGYPFLSCFPEEFVLTAIRGHPDYSSWKTQPFQLLASPVATKEEENEELLSEKRAEGYYFYHRLHPSSPG